MNVAVRPDVLVLVVMAKSLVARDTPLTANDVELKPLQRQCPAPGGVDGTQ